MANESQIKITGDIRDVEQKFKKLEQISNHYSELVEKISEKHWKSTKKEYKEIIKTVQEYKEEQKKVLGEIGKLTLEYRNLSKQIKETKRIAEDSSNPIAQERARKELVKLENQLDRVNTKLKNQQQIYAEINRDFSTISSTAQNIQAPASGGGGIFGMLGLAGVPGKVIQGILAGVGTLSIPFMQYMSLAMNGGGLLQRQTGIGGSNFYTRIGNYTPLELLQLAQNIPQYYGLTPNMMGQTLRNMASKKQFGMSIQGIGSAYSQLGEIFGLQNTETIMNEFTQRFGGKSEYYLNSLLSIGTQAGARLRRGEGVDLTGAITEMQKLTGRGFNRSLVEKALTNINSAIQNPEDNQFIISALSNKYPNMDYEHLLMQAEKGLTDPENLNAIKEYAKKRFGVRANGELSFEGIYFLNNVLGLGSLQLAQDLFKNNANIENEKVYSGKLYETKKGFETIKQRVSEGLTRVGEVTAYNTVPKIGKLLNTLFPNNAYKYSNILNHPELQEAELLKIKDVIAQRGYSNLPTELKNELKVLKNYGTEKSQIMAQEIIGIGAEKDKQIYDEREKQKIQLMNEQLKETRNQTEAIKKMAKTWAEQITNIPIME